jgi:LEA14-like dessication related protein
MSRPLVFGLGVARWLALVLFLLACATPEPPRVSPRVVQVAAVSPGGIDLDVQLGVHNPNSFSIAAKAVSGTLYVGRTQRLGHGEAQLEQPIGARSDAIVSTRVHIAWADVAALLPLLDDDRVPYDFRGDVTLGGESLNLTLPFSLGGELTRAELIQASLRGL